MKTLVIDDEPASRAALVGLCHQHPELGDATAVGSGAHAIDAILSSPPDLMLVETELRHMTGFDMIRSIAAAPSPAFIMVGRRDDQATRALDVGALDILRKPNEPKRFELAVAKFRAQATNRPVADAELGQRRLVAERARRMYFVPISAIDYISAEGNYVALHRGEHSYLRRDSIKNLAQQLAPLGFEHIRRDVIVNIGRVAFAEKCSPATTEFTLLTGMRLRSRAGFRLATVE